MACPPDEKILAYLDGEIKSIEQSLIRDHLLICPACRQTADCYTQLQKVLADPVTVEPPAWLAPQIMKRIFPEMPRTTSIAALIGASFVFIVTWIYIYFDFSRSSLVQALRLTADRTSGWLVNLIKAISAVYATVQAVFKACHAFLGMLLNVRLNNAAIIVFTLVVSVSLLFALRRLLAGKPGEGKR